jgi:hypothetical protein
MDIKIKTAFIVILWSIGFLIWLPASYTMINSLAALLGYSTITIEEGIDCLLLTLLSFALMNIAFLYAKIEKI